MTATNMDSKIVAPKVIVSSQKPGGEFGFYLVLASLVFEFGRLHEFIPGLKLPVTTAIDILIVIRLLASGQLTLANEQLKLWLPLLGLMAIHIPFATNNFWALMTTKDMLILYFLCLGIANYVCTLVRFEKLVRWWLGIHALLAMVGVANGGVGIGGWLGDENDFCMVINMVIPFGITMFQAAKESRAKVAYLALTGLFVLAVMSTLSRGGFIGLVAVGVYFWLRSPRKINSLLIILCIVVFMFVLAPDKYWDEVRSITSEETMDQGTGGDRLYIWGIGIEMFAANPILGIGQGNFPFTFGEYEGDRTHYEASRAGRAAHSAFITLVAELGLVGTGIFVAMLFYSWRDVRNIERGPRNVGKIETTKKLELDTNLARVVFHAHAIGASLIAYLVTSVFVSTLYYPSVWVMMAFAMALRNAVGRLDPGTGAPSDVRISPWNARAAGARFTQNAFRS